MSTIKSNNHQIGQSATATNNATWYQPSTPDGTVRLGVGNAGVTTLDAVTVNNSGNVGIGTSSPGSKLTIAGSVSGSSAANGYDAYTATRASRSFCWGLDASGNYGIWDTTSGANNRLLIDSSGNLGLGVTPSAWRTDVSFKAIQTPGGSFTSYIAGGLDQTPGIAANAYVDSGGTWRYINSRPASWGIQNGGAHYWYTAPSGTAGNAISFTQAMTLDASGRLVVGATSPPNGAVISAVASANQHASTLSSQTTTYASLEVVNTAGSGTRFFQVFRLVAGGSNVGTISTDGSTTSYGTSSDERLKTNVTPAGSAIQSILDFPVDQFDWISSGEHQDFGAVAQKAIRFIPEMVSVPADPNEMWGIDWSKAVPRLIKTIQEMHEEIQTLKQKVNA